LSLSELKREPVIAIIAIIVSIVSAVIAAAECLFDSFQVKRKQQQDGNSRKN
jgi:hypothetical protein